MEKVKKVSKVKVSIRNLVFLKEGCSDFAQHFALAILCLNCYVIIYKSNVEITSKYFYMLVALFFKKKKCVRIREEE